MKWITVHSELSLRAIVDRLISNSAYFEVTPYSCDGWCVGVKSNVYETLWFQNLVISNGGVMKNQITKIMAYESGEMSEDEVIEFFQELIDSGLCWQLQGSYGRMARALIDQGLCVPARREKRANGNQR